VNPPILELLSRATKALRLGEFKSAMQWVTQVLEQDSQNLVAKELLAYSYASLGNKPMALKLLKELIGDLNCPISVLYEYGSLLLHDSSALEAIEPLERALKMAPSSFEVLHDLATAYACVGRKRDAIERYHQAARLNEESSELFYNIGCLHDEVFEPDKANVLYQKSLILDPLFIEPRVNLGINLIHAGRHMQGQAHLNNALEIRSGIDFIYGDLKHSKMHVGDWFNHESDMIKIIKSIKNQHRIIHPFVLLSLVDNPQLHRAASEIYAQSRTHPEVAIQKVRGVTKQKIKVGYFSADFRNHAVANLTAELFELHDKNEFEVYAFSSGFKNNDEMTQRLKKSFYEFMNISELSDKEVVNLARAKGIDIAVDLGGYTDNARTGVFEQRVAPIQVSYLGYLGTTGASHMDYIVADHVVVTAHNEKFYSEKIVYLPHCFQVNDRQRVISGRRFIREELGLPEKGFVFCCFNNSYKITPEVFSSWCQILQKVEGSVLWLYESNSGIAENLRKEARARGLNPDRLVFGGILPTPEYLARYRSADLFLDTFPYNAGTTASDALWAGLPVVTRMGSSFQSRMAASILQAIKVPELIANTIAEYEDLAVQLATHPSELKAVREKIEFNKLRSPLFDTPKITKHIESAYKTMYARYCDGEGVRNIEVM